jgi:hypothetical protein
MKDSVAKSHSDSIQTAVGCGKADASYEQDYPPVSVNGNFNSDIVL